MNENIYLTSIIQNSNQPIKFDLINILDLVNTFYVGTRAFQATPLLNFLIKKNPSLLIFLFHRTVSSISDKLHVESNFDQYLSVLGLSVTTRLQCPVMYRCFKTAYTSFIISVIRELKHRWCGDISQKDCSYLSLNVNNVLVFHVRFNKRINQQATFTRVHTI